MRDETSAGIVLLAAAVVALIWANSPWRGAYQAISSFEFGPEALHLDLSVSTWAADGLLAIFFFVVGLELKTEFVTGSLRKVSLALLPMLAAVGGMIAPAVIYTAVQLSTGSTGLNGWAIPTATDIAFATALLGIFGRGFPPALRTFLLTLAVVDDLLAIVVIAVFYTDELNFVALLAALVAVAAFAFAVRRRVTSWWVLIPLALVAWALMHASGIHATIAGVLLGMSVPARARRNEDEAMTHRFVERMQPWSAGLALPIFAFFAAGVSVVDSGGLGALLSDPVAIGVVAGLVLGKVIGIWGTVALLVKTTRLRLGNGVDLADLVGVAFLAGIGFTVSLLIANLAFGDDVYADHASVAVILGSVISAVLGAIALRMRARTKVRGRGAAAPH
ncbi:Na+/H+ antiporter NhaA [Georgenia faecalis]|uniref:Na(+)/H(+) antiporter NhaA n=1 Tax=Georgenia faecalis TaxID=2483799 RepID=A0ABV9D6X2_9MICO|nr:Na+/H+ antiporter NhaA [Georgenia faecalis]